VSLSLCTASVHDTSQNSSDNLPSSLQSMSNTTCWLTAS